MVPVRDDVKKPDTDDARRKRQRSEKVLASNRRAFHNSSSASGYEAGSVLRARRSSPAVGQGQPAGRLRARRPGRDASCSTATSPVLAHGGLREPRADCARASSLLHRAEILRSWRSARARAAETTRRRCASTCQRGRVKVALRAGAGKKLWDKRETTRRRDLEREARARARRRSAGDDARAGLAVANQSFDRAAGGWRAACGGIRPASNASRPALTASRMARAIFTGSRAPAMPVFIRTASAPELHHDRGVGGGPDPRVDDDSNVADLLEKDAQIRRVLDAEPRADRGRRAASPRRRRASRSLRATTRSSLVYGRTAKPSFTSVASPGAAPPCRGRGSV